MPGNMHIMLCHLDGAPTFEHNDIDIGLARFIFEGGVDMRRARVGWKYSC